MTVLSTGVLLIALVVVLVICNQLQARIALVEVTLNEGLAPGHRQPAVDRPAETDVASLLGPGLHVFLSRGCAACQRVAAQLAGADEQWSSVIVRYVDRPHPALRDALSSVVGEIREADQDVADTAGADPLPYSIAIGEHGLIAQGVTPTLHDVQAVARHAAIGEDAR